MSLRAVITGLLGAAFICGATYFNDQVMQQTMLVGNNFPVGVYGVFLVIILLNPLLQMMGRTPFRGKELAVALAMSLAAAAIPGSGLMRNFTPAVVLPHHLNRTEAGWQEQGVLDMLHPNMLVAVDEDDNEVIPGFMQGLGIGEERIAFSDVPWHAWIPTLLFWLPIVIGLWLLMIGLSMVVHRQWADHEQLPYPVAKFTAAILPGNDGRAAEVMRSKLFIGGAITVLCIHLLNYAVAWFPQNLIGVQLQFPMYSLSQAFPTITRGNGWFVFHPRIFFSVVAFAYLLATDVSLSLGIAPVLMAYVTGLFLSFGIPLSGGGRLALNPMLFFSFGAHVGIFFTFVYTGRYFYANVLKKAIVPNATAAVPQVSVWGARLFFAAFALLIVLMSNTGIDWQLAVIYIIGIVITLSVIGRIVAETGLFFIASYVFICSVMLGIFGARSMGPQTMMLLFFFSAILMTDLRETLMPFLLNGFRTVDFMKGSMGKTAVWCIVAMLVGLAVAVPVQLYIQYDRGANLRDWGTNVAPPIPFNETVRIAQRLDAQGLLEEATAIAGWARFAGISPEPGHILAFGIGVLLVGLFSAARLRFPKWPLHPVMFIVLHTFVLRQFWFSFLLGCLLKRLTTKYGGAGVYRKLQPLMFGMIAGEVGAALLTTIIGAIYFFITGDVPQRFSILPT